MCYGNRATEVFLSDQSWSHPVAMILLQILLLSLTHYHFLKILLYHQGLNISGSHL